MANWIAGAVGHPGALHRQLGIPQGQTIPGATLSKAAGAGGLLGQRARLAETLGSFQHRAAGGPVDPGQRYMVGENGPEMLDMGAQGGQVTPMPPVSTGALPSQANPNAPAYGLYGQRPPRPTNQSVHDAILQQLGVGQG